MTESIKKMEQATKMYEDIRQERKRFLTYNYIQNDPQDVEEMFTVLKTHYKIIAKTTIKDRATENLRVDGAEGLLNDSNKELKNLARELDMFAISKDDLRFEIYKLITDIMQDNIKLRLWVNEEMGFTLKRNIKKMEDHAITQKTILNQSG